MEAEKIISLNEREKIKAAIQEAEKITSGEIRVFVEDTCTVDVLDRAAHLFRKLKLDLTRERNGVLIYVSVIDHKFAIIGDAGIHKIVKDDFWNKMRDDMLEHFKQGHIPTGIIYAVQEAAKVLAAHFPCKKDDANELSDEIVFNEPE
ncbi:MAG: TPM domain-containing protein [Bacteroidota bacterium]